MSKPEKLTKVVRDTFKGNDMWSIWECDEDGKIIGDYPIVKSLSRNKAKILLKHLEELEEFVDE